MGVFAHLGFHIRWVLLSTRSLDTPAAGETYPSGRVRLEAWSLAKAGRGSRRCPQLGYLTRIEVEGRRNLLTWQIQQAGLGLKAKRRMGEVYMIPGWCPAQGSRRALATWAAFAYKMPLVAHVGKLCQYSLVRLTLSRRSTRATAMASRGNLCPTRRPQAQPPSLLRASIPSSQVPQVDVGRLFPPFGRLRPIHANNK